MHLTLVFLVQITGCAIHVRVPDSRYLGDSLLLVGRLEIVEALPRWFLKSHHLAIVIALVLNLLLHLVLDLLGPGVREPFD